MSVSTRITLSHIKNVLMSSHITTKPPLGRWTIHKNKNIDLIIDYANEDHCGSCADYIHAKNKDNQAIASNSLHEIEFSYILLNTPT